MMRSVAGLETGASLKEVDLQAAAETYLLNHGMEEDTLKLIESKRR